MVEVVDEIVCVPPDVGANNGDSGRRRDSAAGALGVSAKSDHRYVCHAGFEGMSIYHLVNGLDSAPGSRKVGSIDNTLANRYCIRRCSRPCPISL